MKLVLTLALFAALLLNECATLARADDLNSAATNAAKTSFPGVKCVLHTENGQTKFRQGETIHLIASFTSDRAGYKIVRYVQNNRSALKLGDIEITPAQGVTDPLGEVPESGALFINGFVPDPIQLGEKPVEFPFVLNDWKRFDKTGNYRITLTTTRVFLAKPGSQRDSAGLIFGAAPIAQIASEPLQIEITPPDESWANQQIELWRDYWDKKANSPRYSETKPPSNDISFLGTRAAMTAIIEHLSHNTQPRSSGEDSYLFRTGFIGFADRNWLIGEMKRELQQPNYAVTQGFFDLLIELETLRDVPRPAGADATRVKYDKNADGKWVAQAATPAQQLQINWENRRSQARGAAQLRAWLQVAAVVKAKTSAARAMTLHSLLELVWLTNLQKEPKVKAQLPQLVAQLAPIFDQLPPLPRAYLLGNQWDRIKSPAFAPAIERAARLPAEGNDYYEKEARDLALKRLAELNPKLGRAQILAQIRQPKPRFGFAALRVLPDATLPALDDVLATNFINAHNENIELSAKLLWRYASPAVLPRIKANYENSGDRFDYASLVATLAYFVRVNPGYGVPKVAARSRINGKQAFYSSFLLDVALLQPSPQLEPLAIANLTNQGEGTASDAAQTLARIGSPAAKDALIARLRNPAPAAYPKVRARLEPRLVEALANAQNWLCPPAQLRQIHELCQTDEGRRTVDEYLRSRADREPLVVNYSSGTGEYWGVDRYSGRGLQSLRAKLAQFPRGTEFFWQSLDRGPNTAMAFETTRKWAAQRGLKIEPFEKIGARRKSLGLT